jgi:hypothetical protein
MLRDDPTVLRVLAILAELDPQARLAAARYVVARVEGEAAKAGRKRKASDPAHPNEAEGG